MAGIVAVYVKRHARECIPKYVRTLREKYEQVRETTAKIAHEIVDIVKHQPNDRYGRLVYEAIEELAEDDADKKYLRRIPNRREGIRELNEAKLRELYYKYVIEPCSKIVEMNADGW